MQISDLVTRVARTLHNLNETTIATRSTNCGSRMENSDHYLRQLDAFERDSAAIMVVLRSFDFSFYSWF